MLRKLSVLHKRESPRREQVTNNNLPHVRVVPLVYAPLTEPDEIRLLCISPRTETAGKNAVSLTIQHVRLSASPLYAAISWTRGRPGDVVDVLIDGQSLTIQRNLSRILEHLQDDHQTRRVWIDAICIDQKKLQERNHQVQLMSNIYSKANYVIACMTAESPKNSRRLYYEARELHKALNEGKRTYTSDYRRFFGNPYFIRRWIVPEIQKAQLVTFCCEGYNIPMSLISDGFRKLRLRTKPETSEEYSSFTKNERVAESRAVQLCRIESETPRQASSLENLLYLHEKSECSDFRDKIYALLPLTSKAQMHLIARYDLERIQLMLSVLHICTVYEDLPAFRTLSFTCFLRHQLDVGLDDLRDTLLHSTIPPSPAVFSIQGVVHGKIKTLQTASYVEEAALRFRNNLDALHIRQVVSLKLAGDPESVNFTPSTDLEIDRQASPATLLHPTAQISAIDQCLFTLVGDEYIDPLPAATDEVDPRPAYTGANGPLIVGFATVRVEVDDEIWQFGRTPVAVVARQTLRGYDLVGRAYLMRDLGDASQRGRQSHSQKKFEEKLLWVKDGTKHSQLTPMISVDYKGLYELMSWVILD